MSTDRSDDRETADFPSGSADAGDSALQPGTRVHEFRILKLIGEGGFGIVYLAHDESLDRTIALKEYMPAQLAERTEGTANVKVRSARYAETFETGMRSFINEARLLARFDHPSLLKVYRFFQENGTAYMAMPFYEGETLKAILRGLSGPPDEKWLRRVLYQLLDGLEVIHAYDCYHRDIAPDNILMVQSDTPVLLDFGAARRVIADATQQLTVILKPGYAPIEQYAEDPQMKQGPWTDIYALAGVVHFALTRKPPPAAIARAMNDELVPLSQRLRGVYSDGFLRTIDAALAVKAQDRPQSVAALRSMLLASDDGGAVAHAAPTPVLTIEPLAAPEEKAKTRDRSSAPPAGVTAPAAKDTRAAPAAPRPAPAGDESSSRMAIAGLVLAVPAALGGLWWWTTSRMEGPQQVQATASPEAASPPAASPPRAAAPESAAPSRDEQAAPAPPAPPPAARTAPEQPPAPPVSAAPKPAASPPVHAGAEKAKAPEPPAKAAVAAEPKPAPKAAAVAEAKPPPVAPPARVEGRPAPPRSEEAVEAPPAPKPPPQQLARVEPKAEPAPPPAPAPKTETPKPPVEVARVEPKAAAPSPQRANLIGRYSGRLMEGGSPVSVTLQILSVDEGAVTGTASHSTGRCQGDYRMTGTVLDDSLRMRSTHSGGRYGDCSFGFRVAVQGTKLVGQTTGGTPLELSR